MSEQAITAEAACPRPLRLTEDLARVIEVADHQPITIGRLIEIAGERGLALVLMILTVPFLLPIPMMGLSMPAGIAVAVYGVCVTLSVPPWMPGFIRRRQISYSMLEKAIAVCCIAGQRIEKLLKPRMKFMLWPLVNVPLGLSLAIAGIVLALPLPLPFSNMVPAIAILLLLAGLAERDGVFVLIGQVMVIIVLALCGVVGYLAAVYGVEGMKRLMGI